MPELSQSTVLKKLTGGLAGALILASLLFSAGPVHAQETPLPTDGTQVATETLYEPVGKQIIQLTDESDTEGWTISALETYGIKFLIRGKEALTWTLNIEDGGFHNPAIERGYLTVLTIVNSLFILGLLAIALMWMFSILIPRKVLKKVILVYSLAVIFVNFALPVNQVLIDGSNLLQKTFLVDENDQIEITDIVKTPAYADALSFRNQGPEYLKESEKEMSFSLSDETAGASEIGAGTLPIGTLAAEGADPQILSLEKKTFTLASQDSFRPYEEQTIFRFLLLLGTGLAYFLIALIFILRIVILWALLILSPLLLLLAIFRSTRAWFYNWLSLYGRWLLIGPLTALGISLIVNVWQMDGLPITLNQNYESETFTTVRDSNVIFYLPGQDQANTLSSTDEMMEYIIFLLMLYLPVFLGFALTRQKVMNETALAISRKFVRQSSASQSQVIQNSYTLASAPEAEKPAPARGGMVENLRQLVTEKIGFLTNEVMPLNKLKSESAKPTQLMPSASNFLPDKLSSTPIVKMLELLGMEKGSKDSKRKVLREMSQWNNISDIKHQEKVVSVLSEIEARAGLQNAEALAILQEVQSLNTHFEPPTAGHYAGTSSSQGGKAEAGSNVTLHVNEQQHQDDKKVRDRSYNEKAGDKNAKREKDKKNQDGKEKSENETQGPEDEGNTSEKSEPITPNNESDAN